MLSHAPPRGRDLRDGARDRRGRVGRRAGRGHPNLLSRRPLAAPRLGLRGGLPGPVTEAFPRGVLMSAALYVTLRTITTPTLPPTLFEKGLPGCWLTGRRPRG